MIALKEKRSPRRERETDRQTDRQAGRQTDRQKQGQTDIETETERQRQEQGHRETQSPHKLETRRPDRMYYALRNGYLIHHTVVPCSVCPWCACWPYTVHSMTLFKSFGSYKLTERVILCLWLVWSAKILLLSVKHSTSCICGFH